MPKRTDQAMCHITVCICTYKRPNLLMRLLETLVAQETAGLFEYSVTVVDNDAGESARYVTESVARDSAMPIRYHVEPLQNIALARNRAVTNTIGDFLALIDDDEFPDNAWLLNLLNACRDYGADVALGPVKPYFESTPPQWIIDGQFCERPSFATGTFIKDPKYTRTGNALLDRSLIIEENELFNPAFGKTGGEDVDFFRRLLKKNKAIVWCDAAYVYESVPPERLTRAYFLRRALLRGVVNADHAPMLSRDFAKSLVAAVVYVSMLPFLVLISHGLFMRYLIRACDHLGKVMAKFGFRLVTERKVLN
jgi:succinoglycan biosynthesis protein ExoM